MRHVRANGFPVPEVFDVDGTDVVMERLDGVTMVDDLTARPVAAATTRRHVGRPAPLVAGPFRSAN